VLNTATTAQTTSFSLFHTGARGGLVTPYLTDGTSATAAQAPIPVAGGSFTATLPARSLVTYYIPRS
jgi:glucuronoarabinoxylan endo-1,4-beta-xylanase